jgi:O-antigen/teichoic acid export membrane protein
MGVIIRQGAKSSLVSYLATVLGIINTIIIYPLTLEIEQLGEVQFVLQTAAILVPFMVIGFTSVSNKFFAKYSEKERGVQGFFTLLIIPPILSAILLIILYYIFREPVFDYYGDSRGVSPLAIKVLVMLTIVMSFASVANSYSANLKRIAVPAILNNFIKITLPTLCILFFTDVITFEFLLYGLVGHYLLLLIVFIFYLRRIGKISIDLSLVKSLKKPEYSAILRFALFGVLAGLGSHLATRIDAVMVTSLKSTYDNGIYSVAMFVSNTIAIPLTLVSAISTPMIAGYWHKKELTEIDSIYKKSSINLFVLGLGVFLIMWAALDGIFEVMPKGDEFKMGKTVILLLGLAKLVDMVSGLNSQILSMSEKYIMFFIFLVILSFSNVFLNIYLIPIYGIEGAAISTLISIFLFNLFKYTYIKYRFKLEPFSLDTLKILVLGLVLFGCLQVIPEFEIVWINLFVTPAAVLVIYTFIVLKMNVSEDLNRLYRKAKDFVLRK